MKTLNNFINEKLTINSKSKISANLDFSDYRSVVSYCQDLAQKKGLKIVFRNRKTNQGDFCFFIYDKNKQKNYLVGYDGDWNGNISFQHCAEQTIKYIQDY